MLSRNAAAATTATVAVGRRVRSLCGGGSAASSSSLLCCSRTLQLHHPQQHVCVSSARSLSSSARGRGGFRDSNRYEYQSSSIDTTYTEDGSSSPARKTALIIGSSGALGSSVAHHLQQQLGMRVVGADVMELPNDLAGSFELDGFIELQQHASLADLSVELVRGVEYCLQELQKEYDEQQAAAVGHDSHRGSDDGGFQLGLDAIICANGGWQGDPPPPTTMGETIVRDTLHPGDEWRHRVEDGAQAYAATITKMMNMNLYPCLAAAYVAQHFLNPTSIMVVMGATAALQATPGMLGYGLAKSASHHLVQTLGACTANNLSSHSIRKAGRKTRQYLPRAMDDLTVVGILPTMIDTEANRKSDPKGKFEQWTKPADIAVEIGSWIENPPLRPHSGSLIKVYPKDGTATFELVR